jgi:hypothetical protein
MFRNRLAKEKWDQLNDAIDAAPIVVPCQNTDPDLWFNDGGLLDNSGYVVSNRAAVKMCKMCPVKAQCLEYAIVNDETFGIWGGMSRRERVNLGRAGSQRGRGRPKQA